MANQLTVYSAPGPSVFEAAFETMAPEHNVAVSIAASPIFSVETARVVELASKFCLPAIAFDPEFAHSGLLLSYAPDKNGLLMRTAMFVRRIFDGATPADLPVELVSRFQLVVNNRTAAALGIKVPGSMRARADA
jgi:putative tryptophan/tyrosine transport system substrate-binding protein